MLAWVVAAVVAGWSVVAVAVGVVLGRVIRLRDRQAPVAERTQPGRARTERSVTGIPAPRAASDPVVSRDLERG